MTPDAALAVDVSFTPMQPGSATGVMRIRSNNPEIPEIVLSVTGEGIPVVMTQAAARPPVLDFGLVRDGASATLPLTIANIGANELNVSGLTVDGDAADAFRINVDSAQPMPLTIAAGQQATVDVTFTPAGVGDFADALSIEGNTTPVTVPLRGRGAVPQIAVDSSTIDLGGVVLEQRQTAVVTVTNVGVLPLNLSRVTTTDPAFSVNNAPTAGLTLSPGASTAFEIAFAPQALGNTSGQLQIESDALTSPTRVALSGRGLPMVTAGPPNLTLGAVRLGESATRTFTIRNRRNAPLPVALALLPPTGAGDFTLENAPQEVAATGEAVVTIRFTPSVIGDQRVTVRITSNATPNQIDLQATGAGLAPTIMVTPRAIDVGNVPLGQSGAANVQIANTGTAPSMSTPQRLAAIRRRLPSPPALSKPLPWSQAKTR